MKMLLASDGDFAIREGYEFLGIPKDRIDVGYITTASKPSASFSTIVEKSRRALEDMGYPFEEFDIEGKSKEEVLGFFSNKNIVHVGGGNAFYLLKSIRESRFDETLNTLLKDGHAVVGTSAGAYVMCPTVDVASWRIKGEERFGITDFTGLGYVPFLLKAHYTDGTRDILKERMKDLKYPLRLLRDGQGILVENGTSQFVGEGKEVVL